MSKYFNVTDTAVTLTIPIDPTRPGKALMSAILLAYLTQQKPECPCGKPNCAVKAMDRLWGELAEEGAPFVADAMAELVVAAARDRASQHRDAVRTAADILKQAREQS